MSFIHSLRIRFGSLVLLATLALSLPASAVISTVANGFNLPIGMVVDGSGNLYVADTFNARVVKVSPSGVVTLVAGNGTPAFGGDGGPATAASLNQPEGVAVDGAGNVYIADSSNRRVRRVDAADGTISTVAGTGVAGNEGDGGPATSANMSRPVALAFDAAGDLYIADQSRHRVRRVSAGVITTFAGTTTGFSGDGGPATAAQLRQPSGLAFDPAGNLYIVDYANFRIRQVTPAGIISTVAGNGTFGTVTPGTPATQSPMEPNGIAYASGALYLSDDLGFVLRVKDGAVGRVAGGGSGGDGSLPTEASLGGPLAVAVGPDGALYILDLAGTGAGSIRKVSPIPTTPGQPTVTNAVPQSGAVEVSFTAPASDGGAPVDLYRVTCTGPSGSHSVQAPASPASIPLPLDGAYTCTVAARNAVGYGSESTASASFVVLPLPTFALTVQKTGSGSGFVSSSPDGLTCGTLCTFAFTTGTAVTLTAAPTAGSSFAGWSGECTGMGTCVVTMNAAKFVTAAFTLDPVAQTITFNPIADRALNQSPFNVSAVASSGLAVSFSSQTASTCSVSGNAVTLLATGPCTIRASQTGDAMWLPAFVDRTFTVTATQVTLNVVVDGDSGSGTVTSNPAGISCGGDCSEAYAPGTSVTLTAQYAPYYRFTAWSGVACDGGVQTHKTCTFTLAANATATATFANPPLRGIPGDLDADDRADLVFQNADGRIAAWTMDGTAATATSNLIGAGAGWSVTHLADLDGNGTADLLLKHTDGRVYAYLMSGVNVALGRELLGAGLGWSVSHAADLDGDGKADLLLRNTDGRAHIWLMDGVNVSGSASLLPAASGWNVAGTGDFNADGRVDIVFMHDDGRGYLYLMEGTTILAGTGFLSAGSGWTVSQVADFNDDGKSDLVFRHADGRAFLYLMNGTTFGAGVSILGAATGWSVTHAGDLDGDFKADLVFRHTDGRAHVRLMDGTLTKLGADILPPNTGWRVTQMKDLNGDGNQDLVFRNDDGRITVRLMNGTLSSASANLIPAGGWSVVP